MIYPFLYDYIYYYKLKIASMLVTNPIPPYHHGALHLVGHKLSRYVQKRLTGRNTSNREMSTKKLT
jgi:hypothetical protein